MDKNDQDIIPGVVVVKFKRSVSVGERHGIQNSSPLQTAFSECEVNSLAQAFPSAIPLSEADAAAGRTDLSRIYFASIPSSRSPREIAARLSDMPEVAYAEPKYRHYLCDVPNDSDYAGWQQTYFDRMNVPAGWSLQKGSPTVVIATVDGGTNWRHPDLLPNLWINGAEDVNHNGRFDQFPAPPGDLNGIDDDGNGYKDDVVGWNFALGTNDPRGFQKLNSDHGTGTASVFGAATDNGRGMAGTGWNCRIMPVCAANRTTDAEISYGYEGIQYAFITGARVINCSWGRVGGPETYSQMEQDVINAATEAGALIVAAAGNNHVSLDDMSFYPAAYRHVLSVGATLDTSDVLASFSNYGANVSVFAPGERIRIALNDGTYGAGAGTSFATPLVAGLAGLIAAAHPGWTPDQIAGQIRMTSDRIDAVNPDLAGSLGHGRVNFGRALSETHASLQIEESSLLTSRGKPFGLKGDTLILSVVVKNAESTAAHGITFVASSTDPAVVVLQGNAAVAALDSGQQTTLPDFKFRLGSVMSKHDIIVRLEWFYNTIEADARTFRATAFPSTGYWSTQAALDSSYFYSVKAVDGNVVWAAGGKHPAPYSPLVVLTTDGGFTWTDVTGNLPKPGPAPTWDWQNRAYITAVDADRAWVAAWDGQIYATTDGGFSWNQQPFPGQQCRWMDAIWFSDANHGYALGDVNAGGLYVVLETSNGGASWAHVPSEPAGVSGEYVMVNAFCHTDQYHLWFGTHDRVCHTTDGGSTWTYGKTHSGGASDLAFRDDNVGLSAWDNFLDRSTDGGATWATIQNPVNASVALCYAPGSRSAWLASRLGTYRTDDDGTTWIPEPTDPFLGGPAQISFSDSMNGWFVTTRGAIVHYKYVATAVPNRSAMQVATDFLLEQNYPNPFNPSTLIRYSIATSREYGVVSKEVKLVVYDVLGREVATLVNERKVPGNYEVRFEASHLASGVYVYRLTTGSSGQSRKMILMR